MLDRAGYLKAREFIYSDIQREINLAKVSDTEKGKEDLKRLVDFSGGANFMTALALLCYTEFAGLVKYNKRKIDGDSNSSGNFNAFFDDLGQEYKAFRKENKKIYNIFRCGLAHEYYVKRSCSIAMLRKTASCGVGVGSDGNFYFCVEKYFEDFKKAFDALESQFFKGKKGENSAARFATTLSVQKY